MDTDASDTDSTHSNNVMATAVKPAYFILENVKADVLFRNMKRNSSSIIHVQW